MGVVWLFPRPPSRFGAPSEVFLISNGQPERYPHFGFKSEGRSLRDRFLLPSGRTPLFTSGAKRARLFQHKSANRLYTSYGSLVLRGQRLTERFFSTGPCLRGRTFFGAFHVGCFAIFHGDMTMSDFGKPHARTEQIRTLSLAGSSPSGR